LVIAFDYVVVVNIQSPVETLKPVVEKSNNNKVSAQKNVDQKKHEKLPVPESNAIVNPRAVMVHIEDTPIASRAVMAAFGLENVAHQTVTPSFVFRISEVKAPKDWDLPWISGHCLDERPHK
jgi:hypothetical protein